jgi:hypothetical protein
MPAGNTFEAIATQTLGSAAATVTFSSISGSYTDLILIFNGQFSSATRQIALQFNSDTGSNYSDTTLGGTGSVAESGRDINKTLIYLGYMPTANSQVMSILQIMNYSNSTTYKTVLSRSNDASGYVSANVGLWRSTAAITSVVVLPQSGNFNTGSTFSLYGIKAA